MSLVPLSPVVEHLVNTYTCVKDKWVNLQVLFPATIKSKQCWKCDFSSCYLMIINITINIGY